MGKIETYFWEHRYASLGWQLLHSKRMVLPLAANPPMVDSAMFSFLDGARAQAGLLQQRSL